MKKILFSLCLCVVAAIGTAKVQQVCGLINLTVEIIDPTEETEPIEKEPILVPSVSLEGYTLIFITPCDGSTLRLVDANDNVVFNYIKENEEYVKKSKKYCNIKDSEYFCI